jgi:hypothetical protein
MPSLPRSLTALLVAAAFTGALAATASADSIVYVKDGNDRLTITARAMVGGATAKATMAFRIVR